MTTGTSIRSAAVLGAGTMGAQIAAHLANAGVPVLVNKRLERPFNLDAEKLPAGREKIGEHEVVAPLISFNYFDPPIPAEILVRNRQLIYVRTSYFRGRVAAYSGVWRASSRWWEKGWSVQEWHVEIEEGGVYSLLKRGGEWFVAGEFD